MKTGLFFGSFNPIHNGHIAICDHIINNTDLTEILFIVSPHNPLKDPGALMDKFQRLELVKTALEHVDYYKASDIEFNLPLPSYTYNTLSALAKENKGTKYVLIVGADSINSFDKWKNHEKILDEYEIFVYPRKNNEVIIEEYSKLDNVSLINAPILDFSSTEIRQLLIKNQDIKGLVPDSIIERLIEIFDQK